MKQLKSHNLMEAKILTLLEKTLPTGIYLHVAKRKSQIGNGEYVKIAFAATDYNINNVQGQKPQIVSLYLDLQDLELKVQIYGGNGGNSVYRTPNLDDPKEKYLAMARIKVPFRKPQANEKAVLNAIEKFAQNWIKAIKENLDTLLYKDIVDYSKF